MKIKKTICPNCGKRTYYECKNGFTCDSCKKLFPKLNIHPEAEPDVCDLVKPGDWITVNDSGPAMVITVEKYTVDGEWNSQIKGCECWYIRYLGMGYMTGESVSINDCCVVSQIVAVGGRMIRLQNLDWNDKEVIVVPKPDYVTVSKSAMRLLGKQLQMELI
jgi:hypothetical protein